MHVFVELGAENWSRWEPNPMEEALVISGPFNYTDFAEGEFTELSANPLYFYRPTPPPLNTTGTTLSWIPYSGPMSLLTWGIAGASATIVAVILVKWRRDV